MKDDNPIDGVVGGPIRHVPVMLNEVLACLAPDAEKLIVDGTFGAGGYSSAILETGARVIAIDRDPSAIRGGAQLQDRFKEKLMLVQGEFSQLDKISTDLGFNAVDGVVLDIGVSSMQLDEVARGFSFRNDGPLDMRMAQSGISARDVVNHVDQKDLTRIIGILGDEKKASSISRAIVRERQKNYIDGTGQLASIVASVSPRRFQDKIHPATRTFQALRIFVNQELEQLAQALFAAERALKSGGQLAVVTFHSLEDRLVKLFFKDRVGGQQGSRHLPIVKERQASFELGPKHLIKPRLAETQRNPRSRSAKLRCGQRTGHEPMKSDMSIFGLPNLVSLSAFSSRGE
ncbi:MAG: 16S rRNA (cytosine(1402)-N(4))-methyltransferase RsmH [Pseudomonadota bacterium]